MTNKKINCQIINKCKIKVSNGFGSHFERYMNPSRRIYRRHETQKLILRFSKKSSGKSVVKAKYYFKERSFLSYN